MKIIDAHAHIFPQKIADRAVQSIGAFYDIPMDDGGTAASSVTVRLLQDGKAWDAVELSEENGWAHTWTGLDGDRTWTVEEIAVPGFRTEVTRQGRAFTIVNDDLPEEPDDPEEPGAPDRPEEPDPQKEPAPPDPAGPMGGAPAGGPPPAPTGKF